MGFRLQQKLITLNDLERQFTEFDDEIIYMGLSNFKHTFRWACVQS